MYPSCETVEYAITRLMSYCAMPIVAARSAVPQPIHATVGSASGCSAKNGYMRAMR